MNAFSNNSESLRSDYNNLEDNKNKAIYSEASIRQDLFGKASMVNRR
jgi:hypothetical protein